VVSVRLPSSCGVLSDAGSGFFCRQCLRLRYESQMITRSWKRLERARSIRLRLGGSANLCEPFPERPKYMRRTRYELLRNRPLLLQAEGLGVLDRSWERRLKRLRHCAKMSSQQRRWPPSRA
jgi:hypothetical protein